MLSNRTEDIGSRQRLAALLLRFSAPKLAANRTHALCSNATYSGRPSVFIATMREQDVAISTSIFSCAPHHERPSPRCSRRLEEQRVLRVGGIRSNFTSAG